MYPEEIEMYTHEPCDMPGDYRHDPHDPGPGWEQAEAVPLPPRVGHIVLHCPASMPLPRLIGALRVAGLEVAAVLRPVADPTTHLRVEEADPARPYPCPHCGSPPEMVRIHDEVFGECPCCADEAGVDRAVADAIARWNRRAGR